jgi:hypothetical protein
MLNGGTLDGAHLTVTSDTVHQDEEHHNDDHKAPIDQSDKPRAGIAAEYLAKGYQLSDHILNRAIEIDTKQGISKRFLNYMHSLDTGIGSRALGPDQTISAKIQSTVGAAAQQARTMDQQQGISKTAGDYYSKALASPLGQKPNVLRRSKRAQLLRLRLSLRPHRTPQLTQGHKVLQAWHNFTTERVMVYERQSSYGYCIFLDVTTFCVCFS